MRILFSSLLAATGRLADAIQRLGRVFATILFLSLAAIWLLFACILYEAYGSALYSAKALVDSVDSLVALDIARNIEFYDLSLKAAAAGFLDPDIQSLPPKIRQHALFDQSANASELGSIFILDTTGKAIADSKSFVPRSLEAGDRDYFKAHMLGPTNPKLFVSHPFQSRLQHDTWAIGVSRRIATADGRFVGVVLGTLKLNYFLHLFGSVNLPPGSSMTIVHDDGTVLVRSPFVDIGSYVGDWELFHGKTDTHSAILTAGSKIDGVERLYAFRRIDDLPIRLVVGVPTSSYLTVWRIRAALMALGFTILSCLVVGLAVTLGSELHRRTLAEKTMAELAATDALTALPNRRCFDNILDHEWARAIREGTSAALLMVDCDFFKNYNDAFGHLQGDEALRAIASALRNTIQRPADLVARFGGEEFAILLPGTDLDGALAVAESVRAAVARLAWSHPRSPFGKLTVSIGIAACLPNDERDALSLVQAADFALYDAKEKGRNQTATGEGLDLTAFGWRAAG